MATAGRRFEMPDGSTYVLLTPEADTDGAYVEMEFVLPAACVPPPPHVHATAVEEYEVIEGRFDVMVDGTWRTLAPGERAAVPVGALHTFRNRSGATVRVRNWHRPAVGFEAFIEDMHATLARAGVRRRRDPRVMPVLAKVLLDHPRTLAPGRRREAVALRVLAALGRRITG